jgi:TolB protein
MRHCGPFAVFASLTLANITPWTAQPPPPGQTQPPPATPRPSQPGEIIVSISGDAGAPPRYAVPDFVAMTSDRDVREAAGLIAQVLWDDLAFEREFYLIPRDTYGSVPRATGLTDIAFDRWRELGADGLVLGLVERTGSSVRIEVRLFNVKTRQSVFAREYSGSLANPRLYAHTIADEIHQHQRALRGVARTKLTFASDRDGERVSGPVGDRNVKEIYFADYDGANPRRLTVNRSLNITPVWSADARALAYTSYSRGYPDIFVSYIYQGRLEKPTAGPDSGQNWLPAWSPDGTRIAFVSNRHGNPELMVMNADGSSVRRLTTHPGIDSTPTWSPTGTQIAFVSDRSGSPQIYVIGADGLNLRRMTSESYCDRPAWSPAPYNEIAYSARSGPGHDIKILELGSGQIRQLTFGEGSNESPSYAPNGRHLAFTTTRWGKVQVATIARTGRDLRQITRTGNNQFPNWSQ